MKPNARTIVAALAMAFAGATSAQPVEPILKMVQAQRQPFLDTLKELTSIEAGSRDFEGVRELGKELKVAAVSTGGGTDAAFAALQSKGAVVEGFGLRGFGAHSNDAEYMFIDSIEPRMYLVVRTVMDFARSKVALK